MIESPAERPISRGGNADMMSRAPEDAQCMGCRYALRELEHPRCPECGRSFDPDNIETIHLPGWSGFLARHFLKPAGPLLYVWPVVAATLIFVTSTWSPFIRVSYSSLSGVYIHVPQWTGIWWYSFELWNIILLTSVLLLGVWIIRAAARRHVVIRYRLPIDRLFRDRKCRRFASACFAAAFLLGGWSSGLCTHGEYWEWWHHAGLVRNTPGNSFILKHHVVGIHLRGAWDLYWRSPDLW